VKGATRREVCNTYVALVDYRGNFISPCFPGRSRRTGSRKRPEEANLDVYEAMLIVIPELDEEQVENTILRFRTIIERTGGEPRDTNHWGRRKLAYEIDNRTDGYYVVMEFTVGERTLVELKRILRVSDDVLRHMVVKLPPTYARRPLPEPAEAAS
jgi:small subunit ribosomal protein S6